MGGEELRVGHFETLMARLLFGIGGADAGLHDIVGTSDLRAISLRDTLSIQVEIHLRAPRSKARTMT